MTAREGSGMLRTVLTVLGAVRDAKPVTGR